MTVTYSLEPNPRWYFVTLSGLPLGAGFLAVYSSLNHNIQKLVYQDNAGATPWPTVAIPNTSLVGVSIAANGTRGPFFWEIDSENPDDRYFIRAYDSNGNLIWSEDDFPSEESEIIPQDTIGIENIIINNVFWRNIGESNNPINATYVPLAPSVHEGLTYTSSNASPDIVFIKNNTGATDVLTFTDFGVGSNALSPDVTPPQYLNYTCSSTTVGETYKIVQIPITQDVQYLSGKTVTTTIWARCNSGANQVALNILQFFGDGASASGSVQTQLGASLSLTSAWAQYQVTATIPSVSGKVIGECGNSGLFFQISLPLSATCNIDMIKPCLYLGSNAPVAEYQTQSEITAITDSPRTGDVRPSFNYTSPFSPPGGYGGWLLVTGSNLTEVNLTIGSPNSGADQSDTEMFPLYNTIWQGTSIVDCPIFTSAGVPTTKTTAILDFAANKRLQLPSMSGRAFSGATSTGFNYSKYFTANSGTNIITIDDTSAFTTGQSIEFGVLTGGVLPSNLTPTPTNYFAIILSGTTLQISATYAGAVNPTPTVQPLGSNGTSPIFLSGTILPHQLASYRGQDTHPPLLSETAAHTHPLSGLTGQANDAAGGAGATNVGTASGTANTLSSGGGNPFSILQPTIYGNYLIKV